MSNEAKCVICQSKTDLVKFRCCNECAQNLFTDESQVTKDIMNEKPTPIINPSALQEVNLALNNINLEDIGCTAPEREKNVGSYYKSVNEWVELVADLDEMSRSSVLETDVNESTSCVRTATYISFLINFGLMVAKAFALTSSSGSYTIISSLADSCLDLIAGTIISCTAKHSKFTREDLYKYPVGKSRVSTVGILVFSLIMAC